jgi:hypothetical protein
MSDRGDSRSGLWWAMGAVGAMAVGAEVGRRRGSRAALSAQQRAALPDRDFALPQGRRYPIEDLEHGRLALTYAMAPSNRSMRYQVMFKVLQRYPQLAAWWNSTKKGSKIPISTAYLRSRRDDLSHLINNKIYPESARRQAEEEDSAIVALLRLMPRLHARAA